MGPGIVAALRQGLAVVIPTDTVYGLAVDPTVAGASQRLFDLKGRSRDVPIAVLVASPEQAWSIATPSPSALSLAAAHWPGPLTLVLARAWDVDVVDLGDEVDTIGVRCPAHDGVRSLCRELGPLATSSANVHGQPTPETLSAVLAALGPVAASVDGGRLSAMASTVVDCTVDPFRVLRQGALQL